MSNYIKAIIPIKHQNKPMNNDKISVKENVEELFKSGAAKLDAKL